MVPKRRSRKSRVQNPRVQRKRSKRGASPGHRVRRDERLSQGRQEARTVAQTERGPDESLDDGVDQLLRLEGLARNFSEEMVRRFSRPSLSEPWDEQRIRRHLAWCFLHQLGGRKPGAFRNALRFFVAASYNENLLRLTPREQNVASGLMRGLETKEIASELKIGTDTVKKHIEKIMRKAGVDNRTALARWCLAI